MSAMRLSFTLFVGEVKDIPPCLGMSHSSLSPVPKSKEANLCSLRKDKFPAKLVGTDFHANEFFWVGVLWRLNHLGMSLCSQ